MSKSIGLNFRVITHHIFLFKLLFLILSLLADLEGAVVFQCANLLSSSHLRHPSAAKSRVAAPAAAAGLVKL